MTSNLDMFDMVKRMQMEESKVTDNLSYFFFSLLFLIFTSMMPTVMTFPLEMAVFVKERSNGWYSTLSYYLAKSIADFPFTLMNSTIYTLATYSATGQIASWDRFVSIWAIFTIASVIGQSIGLLVGALWVRRPDMAVFVAPVSTLPFILLSGFFVKIASMPSYLRPLTLISYWRYAFEAIIITIYGQNRCADVLVASGEFEDMHKDSSLCAIFSRLVHILEEANVSLEWAMSLIQFGLVGKPEAQANLDRVQKDFKDLKSMLSNNNTRQFNLTESVMTEVTFYQDSYVMNQFGLRDEMIHLDIWALLAFVLFFRVAAYFALYVQAKRRK